MLFRSKRLSILAIDFSKHLNEESGGIWFTPEELLGVPEDVLSGLKKGEPSSENEGKLFLTYKYPDLFPTLKYAVSAETRKRVWLGNENKCNNNSPLFKEAIQLRDEKARLLGFKNHAAFVLDEKMAKTPEKVMEFLNDLRERLTPGGEAERKVLMELKKKEREGRGETFDGKFYLWDTRSVVMNNFLFILNKKNPYMGFQLTVGRTRLTQSPWGKEKTKKTRKPTAHPHLMSLGLMTFRQCLLPCNGALCPPSPILALLIRSCPVVSAAPHDQLTSDGCLDTTTVFFLRNHTSSTLKRLQNISLFKALLIRCYKFSSKFLALFLFRLLMKRVLKELHGTKIPSSIRSGMMSLKTVLWGIYIWTCTLERGNMVMRPTLTCSRDSRRRMVAGITQ